MNDEFKKKVNDKYEEALQKGERFWPDSIYKDLLISFAIFLLLVGLASFVGVHPEPKVDPTDATYVPRPEWYFLFLFEFLKYFPGELEWVGAALIPGIAVTALILLPLLDKNPYRHYSKRKVAISVMSVIVVGIVGLTIKASVSTPPQVETDIANSISEKMVLGQDLYSIQCVECHGPDGEGGEIVGVEGLEGVVVKPISSKDEMYTRNDGSLFDIIAYGQPNLGMPPFGGAYGGELTPSEIEYIVTFMRYTWDDRAEVPADAVVSSIPALAEGEVPSYEVHISAVVKRYCLSCHREGKENNNYIMDSYESILSGGDHAPNLITGDMNSALLVTINGNEITDANGNLIHKMPPSGNPLKDEYIDMFTRWVEAGMPNSAADAAALSAVAPAAEATTVETETPAP